MYIPQLKVSRFTLFCAMSALFSKRECGFVSWSLDLLGRNMIKSPLRKSIHYFSLFLN